jgi:hypothetical protein
MRLLFTDGFTDSIAGDHPEARLNATLEDGSKKTMPKLRSLVDSQLHRDDVTIVLVPDFHSLLPRRPDIRKVGRLMLTVSRQKGAVSAFTMPITTNDTQLSEDRGRRPLAGEFYGLRFVETACVSHLGEQPFP